MYFTRISHHNWLLLFGIFFVLGGSLLMVGLRKTVDRSLTADVVEKAPHAVAYTVLEEPLYPPSHPCTNHFMPHQLAHITTTADGIIRAFAANGAGLAAGDLDNDGDLDLVLGAEDGPNTVLWNQGALHFAKSTFGAGPTRAVTVVDIDSDGRRDIVLTTSRGFLHYWHNEGEQSFVRRILPGVAYPAYAINWGDLDGDGDLDLVTASYDAGFLTDIGSEYLLGDSAGVYVYENSAGNFRPTRLAAGAQALAVALWDIDRDGRLDIVVGNDFAVPDYIWLQHATGWQKAEPFAVTAYSTMSLDQGDINNDGVAELLAADMNPYEISPATMAQWLPVIKSMEEGARLRDDPQLMSNALQQWNKGSWQEVATRRGIQATGWSWTSRFGDLDNDGYLDLYVVNGMIEAGTFGHLPDHELIEENQAFRNDRNGYFIPKPEWGLGTTASGRSMIMADLDRDGDLDIAINNLRSPALLLENQLCSGDALTINLAWQGVQNRDAIGAKVTLASTDGLLVRDIRSASGYLSGDAPTLHFGLPVGTTTGNLTIIWPDGAQSILPQITTNHMLRIHRRPE